MEVSISSGFLAGTDVMIFKLVLRNILAKMAVFAQTTARFCKNLIITLVFEKNANFFAEDWQISQKILIITSIPGLAVVGRCRTRMSSLTYGSERCRMTLFKNKSFVMYISRYVNYPLSSDACR
jgi:hypothetical protein